MYLKGYLVRVSLIILFIFSTFPEDWGWYGMWNFQGICKNWTNCCVTLDVNFRPLSGCRDEGRPNLGIIYVRRIWATMWALLFVVGNVFTHPKKVSTRTKRYLNRRTGGIWVKSICQSCAGRLSRIWWVGKEVGLRLELRLIRWHVWQEQVRLSKYCWSVLMRWMKLEPIIQSEVSQKEKHQYSILTHIYGI